MRGGQVSMWLGDWDCGRDRAAAAPEILVADIRNPQMLSSLPNKRGQQPPGLSRCRLTASHKCTAASLRVLSIAQSPGGQTDNFCRRR